jgi:hypothetical protein
VQRKPTRKNTPVLVVQLDETQAATFASFVYPRNLSRGANEGLNARQLEFDRDDLVSFQRLDSLECEPIFADVYGKPAVVWTKVRIHQGFNSLARRSSGTIAPVGTSSRRIGSKYRQNASLGLRNPKYTKMAGLRFRHRGWVQSGVQSGRLSFWRCVTNEWV